MTWVTGHNRRMTPTAPPLHPDVQALAFLLGQWSGEGRGSYPTIENFEYREDVAFGHVGKPFLSYTQRTWALDDARPLHSEAGYLRPQPEGRVELVLAQPAGLVEVDEGVARDGHVELTSTLVARTPSAKDVEEVRRILDVDGDRLRYVVEMAAMGRPLQHHLAAELHRA
jgi:THAP4-like, heme-binding beta-barrel domain